jgi:formylglycine-generating enzyme required for sulfatase activity
MKLEFTRIALVAVFTSSGFAQELPTTGTIGDDQPQRVQRGGSFLCTDQYCTRYMMGTRGKGDIDTVNNNVGFRCVRSNP